LGAASLSITGIFTIQFLNIWERDRGRQEKFVGEIGYLFNLIFTFPIFNVLMLLYRAIGDFGLSIIVLTLIVRLILFPLTLKQLKSMKAMQALTPQLNEIKKKYKDQKAQLEATQALYKEYGVNPVAGSCLPLLVQMPVLFALFYALEDVVKNNTTLHAINSIIYPFLPHFTTLPNTQLTWFTFINSAWHISLGAPDPTHILPILAALATFAQLRMSMAKNQSTTANNDAMKTQQLIMQFISPAMVLFFGLSYAAGLALYWMTSSIFGMVQQYFVTGWGSLLTVPSFGGAGANTTNSASKNGNASSNGRSKTYNGDQLKEAPMASKAAMSNEDGMESPGSNQSKTGTYGSSSSSSSSARRRTRNSSASARRRSSNNVPRRNPSRS
jgi:YidC/Oxa1 family membrane protein insertase